MESHANASVFTSSSTLTNTYHLIAPARGGCLASVIAPNERAYVFFRGDNGYLCYYLSEEDGDSGYRVVQTQLCGQIYRVQAAIAPGGEALALVSYRPQGQEKGVVYELLRESYAGSGVMKSLDKRAFDWVHVDADLLCEGGVVAWTMRVSYPEEYLQNRLFRVIYMGTQPGQVRLDYFKDAELNDTCGPLLVYGADPNRPDTILIHRRCRDGAVCVTHYAFDCTRGEYKVPLPPQVQRSSFQVHEVRLVRTADRRNHAFLRGTYVEGGALVPCLVELTTGPGGSQFCTARLVWLDGTGRLFPDGMDAVVSVVNREERTHVLMHGADDTAQHLSLPNAADPAPIATQVAACHFGVSAARHATVFYQNTAGAVSKLEMDPENDFWEEEEIRVADEKRVGDMRAYTARVSVMEPGGQPCPGEVVELWSDSYLHVEVGGAFLDIGPDRRTPVKTDARGMLTLSHEASALAASDIYLNAPRLMAKAAKYTLRCYEGVEGRLAGLDGDGLLNAKKADGQYLLQGKYRQRDTAQGVAQAVQNLMKQSPGDTFCSGCTAFALVEEGGLPRYRLLERGDLDRRVAQWRQQGIKEFFTRIADFFRSVARGIAKVVETLFEKVGQAVKAVFRFIISGVEYFVNAIIQVVQQAFDAVEVLFSKVMVFFVDLFEWLGDPFDWQGLRRTKAALECVMDGGVALLKRTLSDQRKALKEGADKAAQLLDGAIDQVCRLLAGTTVSGQNASIQDKGGQRMRQVNNFLMDQFVLNGPRAQLQGVDGAALLAQLDLEKLLRDLKAQADSLQAQPQFDQALTYLEQAASSKEGFLRYALAALLKALAGVMQLLLKGGAALLDVLMGAAQDLLDGLRDMMNLRVRIPFLGALYLAVFKENLTVFSLCSLLISAPAHYACKLVQGRPLFADDAALNRFTDEVKRLTTGQACTPQAVSKETLSLFAKLDGGCQMACYAFTTLDDTFAGDAAQGDPQGQSVQVYRVVISGGVVLCGLCAQVFCFPAWNEKRDWSSYVAWSISTVILLAGALKLGIYIARPALSTDTVFCVVGTGLGVVYTAFTIVASVRLCHEALEVANEVFLCLSSMMRVLLIKKVVVETSGVSALVTALVDIGCTVMGMVRLTVAGDQALMAPQLA